MSKPMHAEGEKGAWSVITNVLTIPAKVQGALLNVLLNTIDRAQTSAILKESAELQARNAAKNNKSAD